MSQWLHSLAGSTLVATASPSRLTWYWFTVVRKLPCGVWFQWRSGGTGAGTDAQRRRSSASRSAAGIPLAPRRRHVKPASATGISEAPAVNTPSRCKLPFTEIHAPLPPGHHPDHAIDAR
ncbi:hypothetical protein M8494_04725 [Serratia ureilytica]